MKARRQGLGAWPRRGVVRAVAVLALALVLAAGCSTPTPSPPTPDTSVAFEAVRFETELGSFTAIVYRSSAPRTVALMQDLVNASYFDERAFTRIVAGHVIQAADAAGGAADDPRTVPLEIDASLHFAAGALGIARGSDPDSGGPQFFAMDFATSHLDGNYTVWGQVVEGLGVVHRIARQPAIDAPRVPGAVPEVGGTPVGTTDRMAVPPIAITGAAWTQVRLPPQEAARYPLQVAANVRWGDYRHSLEWPADLVAGSPAHLTWYVRPYNGTEPPAGRITVAAGPATMEARPDGDAPGAYHFTWTPPRAGRHQLELRAGTVAVATMTVEV